MKAKVLCVDDEPHILKALKRLFRNEPVRFITCESPLEALSKLDEIKPALVISDQRMPEMTGTQFLEEVKKRMPDTVRIILTGHADLEVAIAAINQDNVFRFIRKPWNDDELKAEIASALEYHQTRSGVRELGAKNADEGDIRKERLKGAQELAISVRGELGQAMAIISGYAHLIGQNVGKDALLDTYLANIVLQIKRVEALTRKITGIAGCERKASARGENNIDGEEASSGS